MGFRDKLIKKQKSSSPRVQGGGATNNSDGPREYYPKSIGIYCVDNPKIERREIRPYVIGVPPTHKTSNVEFKGMHLPATPYWLGKLFAEPVLVNIGYFPAASLYTGTDTKIFPNSKNTYDKRIPLVQEETGIEIPLSYDIVEPVENERKRLGEVLSKNISDKARTYLQDKLAKLQELPDDEQLRTTHEVKIIPKYFIPVLTTVVTEVEDEEGELIPQYEPKLAIFEETLGNKKANALFNNKILTERGDIEGLGDFLYSDIDDKDAVGKPILLFRHTYAAEGRDNLPPIAAKLYEDKIPKSLLPFFDIDFAPNIDETSLLRIIVLEMIQLFAPKGDTSSIEGKIKEFFWSQVQKGDN